MQSVSLNYQSLFPTYEIFKWFKKEMPIIGLIVIFLLVLQLFSVRRQILGFAGQLSLPHLLRGAFPVFGMATRNTWTKRVPRLQETFIYN